MHAALLTPFATMLRCYRVRKGIADFLAYQASVTKKLKAQEFHGLCVLYFDRGYYQERQRLYIEACESYSKAIELPCCKSSSPDAWLQRGFLRGEQLGEYQACVDDLSIRLPLYRTGMPVFCLLCSVMFAWALFVCHCHVVFVGGRSLVLCFFSEMSILFWNALVHAFVRSCRMVCLFIGAATCAERMALLECRAEAYKELGREKEEEQDRKHLQELQETMLDSSDEDEDDEEEEEKDEKDEDDSAEQTESDEEQNTTHKFKKQRVTPTPAGKLTATSTAKASVSTKTPCPVSRGTGRPTTEARRASDSSSSDSDSGDGGKETKTKAAAKGKPSVCVCVSVVRWFMRGVVTVFTCVFLIDCGCRSSVHLFQRKRCYRRQQRKCLGPAWYLVENA